MDLLGRLPGVHPMDERVIKSRENIVALLQGFPLFKFVRFTIANANS